MTFSVIMAVVNFLFLLLGGVLYFYAQINNVTAKGDDLFPTVALSYMPKVISSYFYYWIHLRAFP